MSASDIIPLFGGHTTQQGQKITGSMVRQTKREVEQVAASTEIAAVREQGPRFSRPRRSRTLPRSCHRQRRR